MSNEEIKTTTYSMKELKRCSKTFEAIQQAFVLSLLNKNGFGFKIKRPERRSQKTLQLMLVEELYKNETTVLLEESINARCNEIVIKELKDKGYGELSPSDIDGSSAIARLAPKYDSEKLKQVKRHRDANRVALSFKELLQMCEKLGYSFKYRSTKPAKMTKKLEKICSVGGNISLSLSEINEIGKSVNESIFERFGKESVAVIVNANDPNIEMVWQRVMEEIKTEEFKIEEENGVNKSKRINNKMKKEENNGEIQMKNKEMNGLMSGVTLKEIDLKDQNRTKELLEQKLVTEKPKVLENLLMVEDSKELKLTSDGSDPVVKEEKFISPDASLGTYSGYTDFSNSFYPEDSVISGLQIDTNYHIFNTLQPMFCTNEEVQTYLSGDPNQFTLQQPNSFTPVVQTVPIVSNQQNNPQSNQHPFFFNSDNARINECPYGDCFISQSLPSNGYYD